MFHSANVHMVQRARRPNALRTYFASSSIIPGKEPFRRGVLFSTVAGIILIIGGLLTWMSFNDIFGARASMMGPLLIALSLVLMFFSLKQFLIARKQSHTAARERIRFQALSREAVAAMVINREDGIGAVTVIMDTVDMSSDASWRSAHSVEYAPPSYSEVLQRAYLPSSSSVRRLSPPDQDFEPPPSYDEAVAALHCRNVVITEPSPAYAEYISHEHLVAAPLETSQLQSLPLSMQPQQPIRYSNSSNEDTETSLTIAG